MLRCRGSQPEMVSFKNPVSSKLSDPNFAALVIDDRNKQIEVIREVQDATPSQAYDFDSQR